MISRRADRLIRIKFYSLMMASCDIVEPQIKRICYSDGIKWGGGSALVLNLIRFSFTNMLLD